jgi:hypothetical protein
MDSWDALVRLASLGTSGVCVLAVFLMGVIIWKLPNNTPPWKAALMKNYLYICLAIAIVSALSGGANAYFNREKVLLAQLQAQQAEETVVKHQAAIQETNNALVEVRRQLNGMNVAVTPVQRKKMLESLKKAQTGTDLVLSYKPKTVHP